MNTVNNIYPKICDYDNVLMAVEKAAEHKKHKYSVQNALKRKEAIAARLSESLTNETWTPCPCHRVKIINDGISLKKREIVCPEFVREQVVHHALMNVCKPIFMKTFYTYSCASIPGRGIEYALEYIKKCLMSPKAKYFTTMDIMQFFNSVLPSKVFRGLRRLFRCKKTLLAHAKILRANKVKRDDGSVVKRGTPIGLYTSPWYANLLLTPLDHLIKGELGIPFYCRYNDDMLLISSNKRKLEKAVAKVKEYLASLSLQLKREPQIHRVSKVPIRYIGYTIRPEKVVLQEKTFLKAKRTANRIHKKGYITVYDARKITSYGGRFKHVNARLAFRRYINDLVPVRKCRQIISKRSREENVGKI